MSVDKDEAWMRATKIARVQADACYARTHPSNAPLFVRLRAKIFREYTQREF